MQKVESSKGKDRILLKTLIHKKKSKKAMDFFFYFNETTDTKDQKIMLMTLFICQKKEVGELSAFE